MTALLCVSMDHPAPTIPSPAVIVLAVTVVALLPSCQLVTVPVKVVGSVAETTVETTGAVVSAPFRAMGGNDNESESDKKDED